VLSHSPGGQTGYWKVWSGDDLHFRTYVDPA
jgi:hypothetical protein